MSNHVYTKVSVTNFGPVKEGEVELRPLTLFIGPNNSGKSYIALLTYALSHAISVGSQYRYVTRRLNASNRSILEKWSSEKTRSDAESTKAIAVEDLPPQIQDIVKEDLAEYISKLTEEIEIAFHDYFGESDPKRLVRAADKMKALSVRLSSTEELNPFLSIRVNVRGISLNTQIETPDISSYAVIPMGIRHREAGSRSRDILEIIMALEFGEDLTDGFWLQFLKRKGFPERHAYYLPSARSGILQGWSIFASMALQVVRRRIGIDDIEVPRLQGVAGDFLQILWDRLVSVSRRTREEKMKSVLDLLEGQVFRGQVSFETSRPEQPLMFYKSRSVQVPLQRASSMVAELAPLDLWLKYLLEPGDLLIIDEPEAHLHPENQRMIARVLIRLMRAGVRVICPTHSSLILHQISNSILISQLPEEVRRKEFPDFTEEDLISTDEVGVYLFDLKEDGTYIKTVPIDSEFGISEDEFVRVAEAIGDQTYHAATINQNGDKELG